MVKQVAGNFSEWGLGVGGWGLGKAKVSRLKAKRIALSPSSFILYPFSHPSSLILPPFFDASPRSPYAHCHAAESRL
jgi:hypothetical protein